MESALNYPLIGELQTLFKNFFYALEREDKLTDAELYSFISTVEHLIDEERDTLSVRNNTRVRGIHARRFIEWIHQQIKKLLDRKCTLIVAIRLIRALCKVEYLEPTDLAPTLFRFLLKAIFADSSSTGKIAKEAAHIFGECLLQPQQSNVMESFSIAELIHHVVDVLQGVKMKTLELQKRRAMDVRRGTPHGWRRMPEETKNSRTGGRGDSEPLSSSIQEEKQTKPDTVNSTKGDFFSPGKVFTPQEAGADCKGRENISMQGNKKKKEEELPSLAFDINITTLHHPKELLPLSTPTASSPLLTTETQGNRSQISLETSPHEIGAERQKSSSPPLSCSSSISSFPRYSSSPNSLFVQMKKHRKPKSTESHEGRKGCPISQHCLQDSEIVPPHWAGEAETRSRGVGFMKLFPGCTEPLPCLFLLGELVTYASVAVESALPEVISGLQQTVRWSASSFIRRTAAEILLSTLRLAYRSPTSVYYPFQDALLQYVVIGLGEVRGTVVDEKDSLGKKDESKDGWGCCCCCEGGGRSATYTTTSKCSGSNDNENGEKWKRDDGATAEEPHMLEKRERETVMVLPVEEAESGRQEKEDDGTMWISVIPFIQRVEGSLLLLNAVLASFTTSCSSVFLDYTACRRGTAPVCSFCPISCSGSQTANYDSQVLTSENESGKDSMQECFVTETAPTPNKANNARSNNNSACCSLFENTLSPISSTTGNPSPMNSTPSIVPSVAPATSHAGLCSLSCCASEYLQWISYHISYCLLTYLNTSLSQRHLPVVGRTKKAEEEKRLQDTGQCGVTKEEERTLTIEEENKSRSEFRRKSCSTENLYIGLAIGKHSTIPKGETRSERIHTSLLKGRRFHRSYPPLFLPPLSSSSFSPSCLLFLSHPLILETLYMGTLPLLAVYDRSFFLRATAAQVQTICRDVMRLTSRCWISPADSEQGSGEHERCPLSRLPVSHADGTCTEPNSGGVKPFPSKSEEMGVVALGEEEEGTDVNSLNSTELRSAHFILLTLLTWVVPEMFFLATLIPFTRITPPQQDVNDPGAVGRVEKRRIVECENTNVRENVLDMIISYIKDTLMMEDVMRYPSPSLSLCPEAVTCFATMAEMFPRAVRPYSRSVMGPLFNKPLTSGFARDVAKICAVFPGLRSACLGKVLQGASTQLQLLQPPLPIPSYKTSSSALLPRPAVKNTTQVHGGGHEEVETTSRTLVYPHASSCFSSWSSLSSIAPHSSPPPLLASTPPPSPLLSPSSSYTRVLSIFEALHQMDFSGYSTLQFLCDSILPFLTHEMEEIRCRAVTLCFKLVLSGCEKNSPCQTLDNGVVIHCGKEHIFLFLKIMKKLIYVAVSDVSTDLRRLTIESFTTAHDYLLALEHPERLLAPTLFDKIQNAIAAARLLGRLSAIHPGGTYPALRRLVSQCVTRMHYADLQFPKPYEHAFTMLAVVAEAAPGLLLPYLRSLLKDCENRLRRKLFSFPSSVLAAALSCASKLSRLAVSEEDISTVRKMQYTVVEHLLITSSPPVRQGAIRALKDMIRTTKDVDIFFQLQRIDMGNNSNSPFFPPLPTPFISSPLPSLPPCDIQYGRLPAMLLGCLSGPLKERLSVRLDVLSLMGVIGALNPHLMKRLLQHASSSCLSSGCASPARRHRPGEGGEVQGAVDDEDGSEVAYQRGVQGVLLVSEKGGVEGGPGRGGIGGRNWRVHMGDRRPPLNVDLEALDMNPEMDSPLVLHFLLDTLRSPQLTADLCACAIEIVIHIISLSAGNENLFSNEQEEDPYHDQQRDSRYSSTKFPPGSSLLFFGMQETFEEVIHILLDAIERHESERHRFLLLLVDAVSLMGRHIRPLAQTLLDKVLVYLPTSIFLPSSLSSPREREGQSAPSSLMQGTYDTSLRNGALLDAIHASPIRGEGGGDKINIKTSAMFFSASSNLNTNISDRSSPSPSSSSFNSLDCILRLFCVLEENLKEEFRLYMRDILPSLVHAVQADAEKAAEPIFRFFSQLGPLLDTHLNIIIGSICDVASTASAPLQCRIQAVKTLQDFGFLLPSLVEEAPRCIHCLCGILKDCRHPYATSPLSPSVSVGTSGAAFTSPHTQWKDDPLVTCSVKALAAFAWNLGSNFNKFVMMLEHIFEAYGKKAQEEMLSCVLRDGHRDRKKILGKSPRIKTFARKVAFHGESRGNSMANRSSSTVTMESTKEEYITGGVTEYPCDRHSKSTGMRTEGRGDRKESQKKERFGEIGTGKPREEKNSSHSSSVLFPTKRLEMLLRFRTRRKTTDDWNQFTHQLSVTLLESSPSPVFRQAAKLAEKHSTFAQHILHAAFRVLYDRGGNTQILKELVANLEEILRESHEVPTEVLQELLNLSEFMERVWMRAKTCTRSQRNKAWPTKERLLFDVRVLADCSERCHLYAKELHYVELQILDVTDASEAERNGERHGQLSAQECTHLVELCKKSIYLYNLLGHRESAESTLHFIEANFTGFPGLKASALPHCIDAELLEKLQWWSKSQSAYAEKLAKDPYNEVYLAGYMRSIDNLGLYHDTLEEWTKKSPQLSLKKRQKIAPYAAHAAWLLRRWDQMKEITECMSNAGYEGVTAHFYKAVVGVSKRELKAAEEHIQQCRRLLDSEISTLVAESYDRAYSLFVGLQQLSELEEFLLILKGEGLSQIPSIDRRARSCSSEGGGTSACAVAERSNRLIHQIGRPLSHWQEIWERRLRVMGYEGWAGSIVNHEFLVPRMQELHLWLQFATLSRQNGYHALASEVLLQLRGLRTLEQAIEEEMTAESNASPSGGNLKISTSQTSSTVPFPSECGTLRARWTPLLPSLALASFQHIYDTEPQKREYTRCLLEKYLSSFDNFPPSVKMQYVSSAEERSSLALCHSKVAYWLFKQKWNEYDAGQNPRSVGSRYRSLTHRSDSGHKTSSPPMTGFHHPSFDTSLQSPSSLRLDGCRRTTSPACNDSTDNSDKGSTKNNSRINTSRHESNETTILEHLQAAVGEGPNNGAIWHLWGTIHSSMARAAGSVATSVRNLRNNGVNSTDKREKGLTFPEIEEGENTSKNKLQEEQAKQKCLRHVMEALKGYVRSLCLVKELEDALGCLSLWFEYGEQLGLEEGTARLEELLLQVPTTVWLKLKPQIVARLQAKRNVSKFVSDSVYRLLEHVATEHPHALLYTLIVAKASYLLTTQSGGEENYNNPSPGMKSKDAGGTTAGEINSCYSSSLDKRSTTSTNKTTSEGISKSAAFAVRVLSTTGAPRQDPVYPSLFPEVSDTGSAARLLQSIKKTHYLMLPTVVEDAELVCREVVRCAATWIEKWLMAIERMKECEVENYRKTLRLVVQPLVRELNHPETESEKQFTVDYGEALLQWYSEIVCNPIRKDDSQNNGEKILNKVQQELRGKCNTLLTRTTTLSSFSRILAKDGRNLSAVVPGEYDAERSDFASTYFRSGCTGIQQQKSGSAKRNGTDGEQRGMRGTTDRFAPVCFYRPPLIAWFDDKIEVLKTKQRPRRMSIHGTDGVCYHFLLKGHGDLRLDERVMQLLCFVNTLLEKHGAIQQRDCSIQTYSVTPLSESAGLVGWVSDCNTMYQYVSAYRQDDDHWLTLERRTIYAHAPQLSINTGQLSWPSSLRRIQMLELLEEAHAVTTGNDLAHVLWMRAPSAETWLDRRTTYVCSLATMSMVGHVMGLGDRHPSNILFHAYSGRVVHIDFGDCFEVAHLRKVDPENVPFRLTRMIIKVLEVGGIHGLFRHSCITTMNILRKERSSIIALLEAFVHDPLVTWGMEDEDEEEDENHGTEDALTDDLRIGKSTETLTYIYERYGRISKGPTKERKSDENLVHSSTTGICHHRRRRRRRETGTVLYHARLLQTEPAVGSAGVAATSSTAHQVVCRIQEKLEGLEFHDGGGGKVGGIALSVEAQVGRLIDEARCSENLAGHYCGWCPFW